MKICRKRTKTGREQKDGKREESGRQKTNTIQNIQKRKGPANKATERNGVGHA